MDESDDIDDSEEDEDQSIELEGNINNSGLAESLLSQQAQIEFNKQIKNIYL